MQLRIQLPRDTPPEEKTHINASILAAMQGAHHKAIVLPRFGEGGLEPGVIRIEIFFYPDEEETGPLQIPEITRLLTEALGTTVRIERDYGPFRAKKGPSPPPDEFFL